MLKKIGAAILCVMLCACGNNAQKLSKTESDALTLVKKLGIEETTRMLEERYVQGTFSFEEGAVESGTVYIHTDDTDSADMVGVFEANDVASARKSIESFLSSEKTKMTYSHPSEIFKIDNAIIEDNGTEVILVICEDIENGKKLVREVLGD